MKLDSVASGHETRQWRYLFYSLIGMLVAFAVFAWQTLLPLYHQVQELEEHYQTLLTKQQFSQQSPKLNVDRDSVVYQPKSLLTIVAGYANATRVQIKKSRLVLQDREARLNLAITGNWHDLAAFLQRIAMSNRFWWLGFQLQLDQDQQYHLQLQLRNAVKSLTSSQRPFVLPNSTPFCMLNHLKMSPHAKKLYAIQAMAMVGYLTVGQELKALIRLPDWHVITVKKGDRIGIEQAVVTELQPRRLLATRDQKTFILSMTN